MAQQGASKRLLGCTWYLIWNNHTHFDRTKHQKNKKQSKNMQGNILQTTLSPFLSTLSWLQEILQLSGGHPKELGQITVIMDRLSSLLKSFWYHFHHFHKTSFDLTHLPEHPTDLGLWPVRLWKSKVYQRWKGQIPGVWGLNNSMMKTACFSCILGFLNIITFLVQDRNL